MNSESLPPEFKGDEEKTPESQRLPSAKAISQATTEVAGKMSALAAQEEKSKKLSGSLEVVRRAKVYPIRPEDLERAGGVAELYESARITPDILRLKLQGQLEKFTELMMEGRFVFGFHEEPVFLEDGKKGQSVYQQMIEGLSRSENEQKEKGEYRGWYLAEEKGGRILAWASAQFAPKDVTRSQLSATSYAKNFNSMLSQGVTRDNFTYTGAAAGNELWFAKYFDHFWYFDTIQGAYNTPFSAQKLMLQMSDDIRQTYTEENGYPATADFLIFYRLDGIMIYLIQENEKEVLNPKSADSEDILLPGANLSSAKFFIQRGCKDIATDWNPNGYASEFTVDGKRYYVVPSWVWMAGTTEGMYRGSLKIQKEIEQSYGFARPSQGGQITS